MVLRGWWVVVVVVVVVRRGSELAIELGRYRYRWLCHFPTPELFGVRNIGWVTFVA